MTFVNLFCTQWVVYVSMMVYVPVSRGRGVGEGPLTVPALTSCHHLLQQTLLYRAGVVLHRTRQTYLAPCRVTFQQEHVLNNKLALYVAVIP